jgi:hypothetical protein
VAAHSRARENVFNTPELLESIIACLPPRDILTVVQRLPHYWKSSVDCSPTIKAKLGIRSQGVTASRPARFTDVQTFPWRRDWAGMTLPMYPRGLTLNSIFYDKTLHGVRLRWERGSSCPIACDSLGIFWSSPTLYFGSYFKEDDKQPSFGPSRTWRDMYLTQPPITTGILDLHPGTSDQDYRSLPDTTICVAIRDQSGITLGLLHDTMFAALGSEFRDTMASDIVKPFWGTFRFASTCGNLSQQCLQTIFKQ